jgi:hypothetical protein
MGYFLGISWGYLWAIKHGWEIPKLNGEVSGEIIELLQKDTQGGFFSRPCLITGGFDKRIVSSGNLAYECQKTHCL